MTSVNLSPGFALGKRPDRQRYPALEPICVVARGFTPAGAGVAETFPKRLGHLEAENARRPGVAVFDTPPGPYRASRRRGFFTVRYLKLSKRPARAGGRRRTRTASAANPKFAQHCGKVRCELRVQKRH